MVSRDSKISHQSFNGLFSLRSVRLKLVERVVENLSVVGEELTHLLEVDLNNVVLSEELTSAVDDVLKNCLEDTLVNLSILGHGGEVGFGEGFHDEVFGLLLELSHLWLVHELVLAKEGLRESHIKDPHVVSDLLVADDTEARHVDCSPDLDLTVAPFYEGVPDNIICGLRNDAANRVGIATEVPLHSFVAESLNIEVAVATSLLIHIHTKVQNLKINLIVIKIRRIIPFKL